MDLDTYATIAAFLILTFADQEHCGLLGVNLLAHLIVLGDGFSGRRAKLLFGVVRLWFHVTGVPLYYRCPLDRGHPRLTDQTLRSIP